MLALLFVGTFSYNWRGWFHTHSPYAISNNFNIDIRIIFMNRSSKFYIILLCVDASSQIAQSVVQPVPRVINPSQGVSLLCKDKTMVLSLDQSVTVGLEMNDLRPLNENCFGFFSVLRNSSYVYTIPLANCGAEVKVRHIHITYVYLTEIFPIILSSF